MFQTFSGSSRRPRQVNLSGQNQNPFAASSWKPTATGTQQTVANAEKERQQRQQERDRLNAAKRIQKVWRGHRTRNAVADSRRKAWDEIEVNRVHLKEDAALLRQSQLLLTFFNSKRRDDYSRLLSLSSRISSTGYEPFVNRQEIQPQLIRLADITLEALQV
jgi:ubiquitin-protein ligase E3 C